MAFNADLMRVLLFLAMTVLSASALDLNSATPNPELFLARASRNAYCAASTTAAGASACNATLGSEQQCRVVRTSKFLHGEMQALVFAGNFPSLSPAGTTTAVVAFRGTDSASNWIGDFLTAMVSQKDASAAPSNWSQVGCPEGDCQVAENWWSAMYGKPALMQKVTQALQEVCGAGCSSLYITGHSLGGILAQMAAADLLQYRSASTGLSFESVHLCGSPRAGNPGFARWLGRTLDSASRVVNFADTVPQLPTHHRALVCNDWGLQWEHVGCERWYYYPLQPLSGFPKIFPNGDPWSQTPINGTTQAGGACQGEDHQHGQGRLNTTCGGMLKEPFPNSCRNPGVKPYVPFDHCSYLGHTIGEEWKRWVCDAVWSPALCSSFPPLT